MPLSPARANNNSLRRRLFFAATTAFVIYCILVGFENDRIARERGFASAFEMGDARRHNVDDPAVWKARTEEAKRLEAARKAADEASAREEAARASANAELNGTECERSIQCIGDKKLIAAGFECKDPVERLAQYQAEWTDGFFEPKFSRFWWKDRTAGVVTFAGDKVRFQNGFGAWRNMVYQCDMDIKTERVLAVRAEAGRLTP